MFGFRNLSELLVIFVGVAVRLAVLLLWDHQDSLSVVNCEENANCVSLFRRGREMLVPQQFVGGSCYLAQGKKNVYPLTALRQLVWQLVWQLHELLLIR